VGEKRGNGKVSEWNCLYDKAMKKEPYHVKKWNLITLCAKWEPVSRPHFPKSPDGMKGL
jgi:hypothetical protein